MSSQIKLYSYKKGIKVNFNCKVFPQGTNSTLKGIPGGC